MQVQVEGTRELRFDDGAPVRSPSAVAPLGAGWLVAQEADREAAWVVDGAVRRLPLPSTLPGGTAPHGGGLAAACRVGPGVLLLGSGATAGHRGGVLVRDEADPPVAADLGGLYAAVADALDLPPDGLDLQGVARNGGVLRWFHRGVPGASVDVGLRALLDALLGRRDPAGVPLRAVRRYLLRDAQPRDLAPTDAVALPGGRVLLSAAPAEGPGSTLVLLDGEEVLDVGALPAPADAPDDAQVVQGLAVRELLPDALRLIAVADGPDGAVELSLRVVLPVSW